MQRKNKRGISKINDFLYLGGVSDIKEAAFVENQISHVVNMAEELYNFKYPVEGLSVHRANIKDSPDENILLCMDTCLNFIHNARQEGGHIFVHCLAGSSRSASVVIAYLIKYSDLSLKEAYHHACQCRDNVYPNAGFWNSLIEFELQVRDKNSVEIRPYLTGKEPDVNFDFIRAKILHGWFPELMCFYAVGFCLLLLQIIFLII